MVPSVLYTVKIKQTKFDIPLPSPLPRPALPGGGLRAEGREDGQGGRDGGEGEAGSEGAGELCGLSQEVSSQQAPGRL